LSITDIASATEVSIRGSNTGEQDSGSQTASLDELLKSMSAAYSIRRGPMLSQETLEQSERLEKSMQNLLDVLDANSQIRNLKWNLSCGQTIEDSMRKFANDLPSTMLAMLAILRISLHEINPDGCMEREDFERVDRILETLQKLHDWEKKWAKSDTLYPEVQRQVISQWLRLMEEDLGRLANTIVRV
jgi:hypothetical protein